VVDVKVTSKTEVLPSVTAEEVARLFFEKLHSPSKYRNSWRTWVTELKPLLEDNPELPDIIDFALTKDDWWSQATGWRTSKEGPLGFLQNNLGKIQGKYDQWKWDNRPKEKRLADHGVTETPEIVGKDGCEKCGGKGKYRGRNNAGDFQTMICACVEELRKKAVL
jgi:hypothetical protein